MRSGWNQSNDRLRFQPADEGDEPAHPLVAAIRSAGPFLLIRRFDREAGRLACVRIAVTGEFEVLSNDQPYAHSFITGLILECPPAFHTSDEWETEEAWVDESPVKGMFAGLVAGAMGWDPEHGIPQNIRDSLEEAEKSLAIDNYRSCVVMSRRTLEGVLRFGFPRLLKRQAVNNKGKALDFNGMIQAFRNANPPPIPLYLLHVIDSIRLLGNVPGAHPVDIKGYQFSRSDADFALHATYHFLDQYFSKIDTEVTQYYTLTIDLTTEEATGGGGAVGAKATP